MLAEFGMKVLEVGGTDVRIHGILLCALILFLLARMWH